MSSPTIQSVILVIILSNMLISVAEATTPEETPVVEFDNQLYEIESHFIWEVSTQDVIITKITHFGNVRNVTVTTQYSKEQNRDYFIYDYERYINGKLDLNEWFIEFKKESNSTIFIGKFPDLNVSPDMEVIEKYKISNYVRPAPIKKWWLFGKEGGRVGDEKNFPYDRYYLATNVSPDLYRIKLSGKVILPYSLVPEEKNASVRSPELDFKALIAERKNGTENFTIKEKIATLVFGREKLRPSLASSENNNLIAVLPPIVLPSKKEIDDFPNFGDNAVIEIYFSRPDLYKNLFLIFLMAMFLVGFLIILDGWRDEKIGKTIQKVIINSVAIWFAQEGLIALLPISRPLIWTLYDKTIYIPIALLILYVLISKLSRRCLHDPSGHP